MPVLWRSGAMGKLSVKYLIVIHYPEKDVNKWRAGWGILSGQAKFKGINMVKKIILLNSIIENMEYIKLLLVEGHEYVVPLHTYNLAMKQLNELKDILENDKE